MKKLIFIFAIAAIACNEDPAEKTIDSDVTPANENAADITYPYTASYSSKFEMGDPKHSKIIMEIWKDWDNNTLDNSTQHFADSVNMSFPDGTTMSGSRDSITAASKAYRETMTEVSSHPAAFMPLKATDKNENWVAVWGKEVHTMNGKKDSINLHEIWLFNDADKVVRVVQYSAKIPKE